MVCTVPVHHCYKRLINYAVHCRLTSKALPLSSFNVLYYTKFGHKIHFTSDINQKNCTIVNCNNKNNKKCQGTVLIYTKPEDIIHSYKSIKGGEQTYYLDSCFWRSFHVLLGFIFKYNK